jgi:site-specific DNA-methyltransferase (adenine-specific)
MIHYGDCLEIMPNLPDKSIDMILCDLPYGTTACKWDTIIPFEPLWKQYKRLIKDNGAIVLTASQPFTSALVMSNPGWFKHRWIWDKVKPSTGLNAKKSPLRVAEEVCVFSPGVPAYFPQMLAKKHRAEKKCDSNGEAFGGARVIRFHDNKGEGYPKDIITISNADQNGRVHPTQKPVSLFEYLIRTYTNEGDTVLDNCAGSGTTGIAAMNTNRKFILIEKDAEYFSLISKRLDEHEPLFANTVSI